MYWEDIGEGMPKILLTTLLCISMFITACSSTNSTVNNSSDSVDGLSYYMPKRDFTIAITIGGENEITNVVFGTTPAYADLSKHYVLKYNRNYIFKNSLKIGVDKKGLLQSALAQTENTIPEALGELQTIGIQGVDAEAEAKCVQEGEHLFIIPDPVPKKKDFVA